MKKKLLKVVEGAQGVGKTGVTNGLRDSIPYTQLVRMSGTSDKTLETGREKVYKSHKGILYYAEYLKGCDLNIVLDRSFITQEVYSRLGYVDFSFTPDFEELASQFNSLASDYEVQVILLTASEQVLEERLKRDKPQHLNIEFNKENSRAQQVTYLNVIADLQKLCPCVSFLVLDTSHKTPEQVLAIAMR